MGTLRMLTRNVGPLLALMAAQITTGRAELQGQAVYASLTQDMEEREYAELRGKLVSAAELMPANLYDFRAVPEIRTFGEELNHAADVNFRLCGLALGEGRPATPAAGGPPRAKDDILDRLVRSLELCDQAFDGMTDESALESTFGRYVRGSHMVAMLGHGWHEYGKLTVLLRLNGLSPQPGS